jgi:polyhydroxyalkanoate synthesis repressor PhaR
MTIIIKRYPNRKLYDTDSKRYVTLDYITQLIHEGREVQVVDYETGEDLTNLTLSQIIFEQEKKGSGLLPRALLTNLVRAGGDTFDQVRRALLRGPAGEAAAHAAAAEQAGDEASPLQKVDDLFQDLLASLNVPTNRDLQRLQTQVDELNHKIADLLAEENAEKARKAQKVQAGTSQPGAGGQAAEQAAAQTAAQIAAQEAAGGPPDAVAQTTAKPARTRTKTKAGTT